MRLGEYLEIGKKIKAARTNAGINQRDMAVKLGITNSTYSNYENVYSEPPVEIILKFCEIIGISFEDLLGQKVATSKNATVRTFADFLAILIDLDRR
uniref:helix-turn-helix domain-containing protein n=1 Tax=Agathobacter rectalis TaxID=39491 RepID=UPI0028043312|nr:helix-turn-helix transcriptional regulator [uncultured Agathobacter sp.]